MAPKRQDLSGAVATLNDASQAPPLLKALFKVVESNSKRAMLARKDCIKEPGFVEAVVVLTTCPNPTVCTTAFLFLTKLAEEDSAAVFGAPLLLPSIAVTLGKSPAGLLGEGEFLHYSAVALLRGVLGFQESGDHCDSPNAKWVVTSFPGRHVSVCASPGMIESIVKMLRPETTYVSGNVHADAAWWLMYTVRELASTEECRALLVNAPKLVRNLANLALYYGTEEDAAEVLSVMMRLCAIDDLPLAQARVAGPPTVALLCSRPFNHHLVFFKAMLGRFPKQGYAKGTGHEQTMDVATANGFTEIADLLQKACDVGIEAMQAGKSRQEMLADIKHECTCVIIDVKIEGKQSVQWEIGATATLRDSLLVTFEEDLGCKPWEGEARYNGGGCVLYTDSCDGLGMVAGGEIEMKKGWRYTQLVEFVEGGAEEEATRIVSALSEIKEIVTALGMEIPVLERLKGLRHVKEALGYVGCWHCGKTTTQLKAEGGGNMKTCGRCKKAKYCSAECSRANWKSHKKWCQQAPK
ncbi:hypothetical protein TeGR_g5791 [Tetraparma gracilis]|uniref:MYND-type domain-containing protein n=1 Tax=Tetraparma gracilis TaxID=2962635 RepID=A0ABQ6M4N8_9STRA|nr:hypothetical protein TeGR_g5791 [Tetraparma gracilis]